MAAFRQTLDDDLRRFIREGVIAIADSADVDVAIEAIREYIRRQRNPLLDRLDFYRRCQQRKESFDNFYTSLRELYHACAFSDNSVCSTCSGRMCSNCTASLRKANDDLLRDRIVTGLHSDETRHKLLAMTDLTLSDAVKVCRAEEAAVNTSSGIPSTAQAFAARRSSYQKQKSSGTSKPPPVSPVSSEAQAKPKCSKCGRSPHTKHACPAAERKCNNCQQVGHFQSMCPKKSKDSSKVPGKVGQLKLQRASAQSSLSVSVATQLNTEAHPTTLDLASRHRQ